MRRRVLPLAVLTAGLSTAAVLADTAVSASVLAVGDGFDAYAAEALAAGAGVGLSVCGVTVLLAHRFGSALRDLRREAVHRLQVPSAPLDRPQSRLLSHASAELLGLAAVLDALHLRVRLGDQIGERHRLEAETAGAGVFELLSGLVAAEEGARGQLAAELHDTVAQSLMIARRLLDEAVAGQGALAQVIGLEQINDAVQDAEEQVRAVMARTRPPALREGDLALAVTHLRLDVQARYALDVHVVWPDAPYPLPLATAITVYRFFQEALLNVIKHADVDEALLELVVDEELVRARVLDAGPGFDLGAVRPQGGRHVGLGLLRERARLSGGTLDVSSAIGQGTTLTLQLPRRAAPHVFVPHARSATPVQPRTPDAGQDTAAEPEGAAA